MTHERIEIDPTVAGGRPAIRGTQVPVHRILDCAARGLAPQEIAEALPELTPADVEAAFAYAAALTRQPPPAVGASPNPPSLPRASAPDGKRVRLDLNKILIVDDLELNRLYMQTMFKGSGYQLIIASDGEEALQKARAELPFLILSDVQMPRMNGFELCEKLKADARTRNAAVIFVTAHHRNARQVSEGLDMGADDYIFRPFERGELLSRVRAVARLKRAEEEARRQARTVARRNKSLELLHELALAVTSSLDLQEVFASALQGLSQLLEAEAVALLLLNRETQQLAVNVSTQHGERVATSVDFRPGQEITGWVIREQVPDLLLEILRAPDNDLRVTAANETPAVVCLPLVSREQIIGATAIVNKRGETFAAEDWVLLNSAAGIVAVAVENARLLQDVQQQVTDLVLLNKIGHALTSTLDLEQILKRTAQLVQKSLRAEAASLWLLDDAAEALVLTASSGLGERLPRGTRLSLDAGITGHIARTGEAFFSADLSRDLDREQVASVVDPAPGSMLCVPVQVKDQIIGLVQALHAKTGWFDQNDLRLLYSVASSLGIAIENARLFNQVRDFNRHLEHMVAERTRELATEKEKTEAILASMADGLLVLDAEKCILTANAVAEEMLDFCLNRVRGRPIEPAWLENPLWRCIHEMAASSQATASASVDVPDEGRLGGLLSIQAHAAQVRDEAGAAIGTVVVLRDITALKEVERVKARFMAGVTHELKTPLAVIRLHANNLQTYHDRLPERKRAELLSKVQNQVRLLEQLVEGILDLSRLDAGEARPERERVDLAGLIDQVLGELQPLAQTQEVTLRWTNPGAEQVTWADPDQMERVIRNLVDNGIKYTPAGGDVTVQLERDGSDSLEMRVTDTGIGIPPEHQPHVFDRFYRVDPSHTIPGTGLGLAIVKEIVEAHAGAIQLESHPGDGSTFIVSLPGTVRSSDPPTSEPTDRLTHSQEA